MGWELPPYTLTGEGTTPEEIERRAKIKAYVKEVYGQDECFAVFATFPEAGSPLMAFDMSTPYDALNLFMNFLALWQNSATEKGCPPDNDQFRWIQRLLLDMTTPLPPLQEAPDAHP